MKSQKSVVFVKNQNLLFTHVSQGPQLSNVLIFFSTIIFFFGANLLYANGLRVEDLAFFIFQPANLSSFE